MDQPRTVLITGVSRGLGLAMADQFIRDAHQVIGCARSAKIVDRLRRRWPYPHRFDVVDVASDHAVGQWATSLLGEDRVPDLLLNNAALINRNAALWEVSADEFSQVIDANIKGTFHMIRHFVPAMIQRGRGVIVNFSSGWGRSTSPDVAPYCATKWAIEGLTRALADELPRNMAAIPLNPGVIHTEMLESCFGEGAKAYAEPDDWASTAVPFLLGLGPEHNGHSLTAPG